MNQFVRTYSMALVGGLHEELEKEAAGAGLVGKAGRWAKELVGQPLSKWWADPEVRRRLAGRLVSSGVGGVGGGFAGAYSVPATGDPELDRSIRVRRAIGGAALGSGLGLGAGQFVTQAGRRQAVRVAKRQAHGLTGYLPRTEEQIAKGYGRFGKGFSNEERLAAMRGMKMNVEGPTLAEAQREVRGQYGEGALARIRESIAARTRSAHREAALHGYTSIPGFMKGIVKRPGHALTTGTMTGGVAGVGLMGALTVPMAAEAMKAPPNERAARMGRLAGETVGYVSGSAIPIVGNIALGSAFGRAGEAVGRGVGRILPGTRPPVGSNV